MSKSITKEQVKHIANLAKLNIPDKKLDKYVNEFNAIVGYISKINEVDTSNLQFKHNLDGYTDKVFQEDNIQKNQVATANEILKVATKGRVKTNYIRTSKIIDKQ